MKKIKKTIIFIALLIMLVSLAGCGTKDDKQDQFAPLAEGETLAEIVIEDFGSIHVRFFDEVAPKAVENFIGHANDGYYDGVTFHRIIEDFMIQGGDPSGTGAGGESIWGQAFEDEFSDDLQPYRGALCMANSGPNTNGSQFFIVQSSNTYDQGYLKQVEFSYGVTFNEEAMKNYDEIGGTPWLFQGHTVFGQVVEGYDVLDAVASVELANESMGIPLDEVVINTVRVYEN